MTSGLVLGQKPITGDHPDPGPQSEKAGLAILSFVEGLAENDLLLCLLSGGGSSLAAVPEDGLTILDLALIGRTLRDAGVTINDTNAVRSQIDKLKGGGVLSRASAKGARVATIALSDVPGDFPAAIASGPSLPPTSLPEDARRVVADSRFEGIAHLVERGLRGRVPIDQGLDTYFCLGARNEDAVYAAIAAVQHEGIKAYMFARDLQGEARELGRRIGRYAAAISSRSASDELAIFDNDLDQKQLLKGERPICLVAGGEATVTKVAGAPDGKGGRTFELALAIGEELQKTKGITIVVLATDGDDGNSGSGGAVVTSKTSHRAVSNNLDSVESHRLRRATYSYFEALRDAIDHGPTETNVNDIVLIFIE